MTVDVVVRRPGWLGWALGATRSEQLTLRAPVARVTQPWMTVRPGAPVRVVFDQPVSAIAYETAGDLATHRTLGVPESTISLGSRPETGAIEIAAAAAAVGEGRARPRR